VKLSFEIVPVFEKGFRTRIYTFRLNGEVYSEFKKFEINPKVISHPEFFTLISRIDQIRNKYGCRMDWFKDESEFYKIDAIKRILCGRGDLRLYCIRWSDSLLFLGDGGIKMPGTNRLQENPPLLAIVKKLESIYKELMDCMQDEGITIEEIIRRYSRR